MSKEEFLKIQTCVLKVNIHCDGCKQKVKKILQKIDGVFTTKIDSEQGKVTVSGNVDPAVLIKKLAKSGKHAEVWGAPKPNNNKNNNPNQMANQLKIDNGKGGINNNNNKGQKVKNNNVNNQPKLGGGGGGGGGMPTQQQLQQMQQLQQFKAFQDLKLPQFKDMKSMPPPNNQQKAVKFAVPEDEEFSDDDYDDEFDDDEFDDELDGPPHPALDNKMKAVPQPHQMMSNGLPPHMMMNAQKGAPPLNSGVNAKKVGVNGAIQINIGGGGGGEGKNGNGGKKGGAGGGGPGGNQNHGAKNGGGKPQDGKNGNNGGGGGGIKNGNHGGGGMPGNNMQQMNGGKKGNGGGGGGARNDGFNNMGRPQGNMGQMGAAMAPMGNMPMGNGIPAVQGLPASASAAGGPNGYFQGAGPDAMPGNPYHQQQQQQYLAAVMNQQRAMGNERFQPMMYARPPPAVNYMAPNPYPYPSYPYPPPPHPHGADPYTNIFSDENTSSCNVM